MDLKLPHGVWHMVVLYPLQACLVAAREFVVLPEAGYRDASVYAETNLELSTAAYSWVDLSHLAISGPERAKLDRLLANPQVSAFYYLSV